MREVGDIVEIKGGLLVWLVSPKILRIVGIVDFSAVQPSTVNQLGREIPYSEESLNKNSVLYKTFTELFVQPAEQGFRIVGVTEDRSAGEIIFRVVGFIRPKDLEATYKAKLAQKEQPEEVPYWEVFNLGDEWFGTRITRPDSETLRLTNGAQLINTFPIKKFLKQ
ncbi:MAG: hypothetical protein WC386_01195 [Candidatus Paceibacterota bacterium]|jgi:hypothetical protein